MRTHGLRRFLVEDGIRHLILAPLAFLIVFPIAWMVLTSLKPSAETILWPPKMLPQVPTLQNYYEVFVRWPFLRFFLNSLLVSGVSTVMILLTSSSAGYAFAKIKSRWLNAIFFVFIATIIVPFESYMIPVYLLVNRLGWLNSYPGLILPFVIMAFGVFFMRQTIQAIPDELIQAADHHHDPGDVHHRDWADALSEPVLHRVRPGCGRRDGHRASAPPGLLHLPAADHHRGDAHRAEGDLMRSHRGNTLTGVDR
jgi:large-conductance mechanosensitive channel